MSNLNEEEALGKAYDSRLMRRLLQYMKPYKWRVVLALVMVAIVTPLELAPPLIFRKAIESYFDRNPVGRLVTRVTTDVDALNDLFAAGVVTMINDFFLLVVMAGLLFKIDARLALATLAVLPGILIVTMIFWSGGIRILSGGLTLGVLTAFTMFAQRFFRPIQDLSEKFNILQSAM